MSIEIHQNLLLTTDSAVSFAVRTHSQEKRVLFQTLLKAARDEAIFAFVPSVFFEPCLNSLDQGVTVF